jgi:hypothetical protein
MSSAAAKAMLTVFTACRPRPSITAEAEPQQRQQRERDEQDDEDLFPCAGTRRRNTRLNVRGPRGECDSCQRNAGEDEQAKASTEAVHDPAPRLPAPVSVATAGVTTRLIGSGSRTRAVTAAKGIE